MTGNRPGVVSQPTAPKTREGCLRPGTEVVPVSLAVLFQGSAAGACLQSALKHGSLQREKEIDINRKAVAKAGRIVFPGVYKVGI